MKKLQGKAASAGIACAKVFKVIEVQLDTSKNSIMDIDAEIIALDLAVAKTLEDVDLLIKTTKEKLGEEHAQIFEAHKQIIQDPAMLNESKEMIKNNKVNAAFALNKVATKFIDLFASMEDEYMKERTIDIKDTTTRILHHLLNVPKVEISGMSENSIIVADDLTPSQTSQLNKYVKGFVTAVGGKTSHSAIMARSLELPAIVGLNNILKEVKNGDELLIDGSTGDVIIAPSKKIKLEFKNRTKIEVKEKLELQKLINKKSITKDGHEVEVASNIGTLEDLDQVIANGAEAVGLFRTEFLYMNSSNWPTEEKQFETYKEVLERMNNKGVVIRTLDIGGDKKLPYFKFPEEMNPFLGYRAIRLCLDKTDIFRTQLRALLRASKFGNLKIMFPLIAVIEEFTKAKEILEEEKAKLVSEGVELGKYEVGMMMEVPTAVILADKFAKLADFFSIGTNDLLQYTFACDRMNNNISYLYQPLSPATLRFIKSIISSAHAEGKWVGMCGEMAGDLKSTQILLGLGLDEFSMSATSMLKVKSIIRNSSMNECKKLAEKALGCSTEAEVLELIKGKE